MENDGGRNNYNVYSHKVKAGRKRTYFFDVMRTRSNDFYLTLTESTKRADGSGYNRHQIFLYKEDFNRFAQGLNDVINHVKTELLPDYDYDQFAHREPSPGEESDDNLHKDESDKMDW